MEKHIYPYETNNESYNKLVGIGLRNEHMNDFLNEENINSHYPKWLEVHSDNYLYSSNSKEYLCKVREKYQLSMHGVGMSLGSNNISTRYLKKIKELINDIDPFLISEHLSWSSIKDIYIPDLIPIPYNKESYRRFADNINYVQDYLKRQIIIENPSSYLIYKNNDFTETEFLNLIAQ
ncbi:MAG TPA: DUF692 family protein [Candidatus Megaira endosymbiont of Hartmannula sinica]|nr:DUF692 family protein [Candidatus Megaera endosymbiont of Hartmannula sinica]